MLQAIVRWSLYNRAVVLVLAALLLAGGFYAATHAKLDVFPEFAPPQVVVQTEAPGLSPRQVEQLVTTPIEQALNGLPGLSLLRSETIQGLSVVTVIFQDNSDVYRDRQLVAERLGELAGTLPAGVKAPRMAPLTSTTGRLLIVGFTSEKLSQMDLYDRVQWTIRPQLLGIPGVANVTLYGGEVRQLQVQVNPEYLRAHDLTLTDVLDATRQGTGIRGAGFQENSNQRLFLLVDAQSRSAAELGQTVLRTSEGTPVRLRDVANVRDGPQPKFGAGAINGQPGVVVLVYQQYGSDVLAATRRVDAELDRMRSSLEREGIQYHSDLFRQAGFITLSINNVTHALLIGAGLVVVVLVIFLFNLRTAFISLLAIPLSLLGAVFVLWAWGTSLNTLTLGGLAIAVGEVVDDAVIDVENIYRRLRENTRLGHPRSALEVILSASLEVRRAVVYATFVVALVFVPVFLLSGLQGRLFAPLGYAYVLAVFMSLAVALTVTLALSLLLLPRASGSEEPPLVRRLQGGYEWLLRRLDCQLPLLLTVVALLVAAAGWAVSQFGGEFLPDLKENNFIVHVNGVPGTSLEESMAAGKTITEELRRIPGVVSVTQTAGRAELGEDIHGVEQNELPVNLTPDADPEVVGEAIKGTLRDKFAGFNFEVNSFLTERIGETISGATAPVVIKVFANDLATVDRAAREIAEVLAGVPGSANVLVQPQTGQPQVVVRIRPEDAALHGLRKAQILEAVSAAYQGAEVGQAYDANRIIGLVVILDPKVRNNPDKVADLWLSAPSSSPAVSSLAALPPNANGESGPQPAESPQGRLQLKQVADIYLTDGRFLITHEGARRMRLVTGYVQGRDVQSFVTAAQARVQQLTLPADVSYLFTGANEAMQQTKRELLALGCAAAVGILLLLLMVFGSVRKLLLVLVNLPFALVGGVGAIYLMGSVLDVGSLVGFVTLFGITMRNSMMMVSHWQHLHEVEGMPWGPEVVFRGARERLAPILMTATVTALGLLPIAIGTGEAGREIEGPMALVILGGLVTSTGLNLFVLPVLYRRFGVGQEAAA
jgi:CzcA family heavy metal efflux pump